MISLTGLLNMMDGLVGKPLRENVDAQRAGGWVGHILFQFRLWF